MNDDDDDMNITKLKLNQKNVIKYVKNSNRFNEITRN